MRTKTITLTAALLPFTALALLAHEGHGKKNAPASAKALKNPLTGDQASPELGKAPYEQMCAGCHGADGRAQTTVAAAMKPKPTNLVDHRMSSMTDGEVYWVATNGIGKTMPGFKAKLSDEARWQVVGYVRELGRLQAKAAKANH